MKVLWVLIIFIVFSMVCNSQTYFVEDYGAKSDNYTNNAAAIQSAIDACSQNIYGGTVILSKGKYLSGTIQLKSNVCLEIKENSILKAIADTNSLYKIQSSIRSRMDHEPRKAFIYADSEHNIKITGGGIIDGSGDEACFQNGIENSVNRPYGILMINCKNVTVKNMHLNSSAFWMQRYFNCRKVYLTGISVYNHANLNNDGIDIDSSEDVIISDCFIDSSDDAICIKSEGENPSKNIVINNCIVSSHASGIKLGTGSIGGFENITISNCIIRRSSSTRMIHAYGIWGGLTGIELITTDGGPLRSVNITNISIEDVQNPIHIRLGNRMSGTVNLQGDAATDNQKKAFEEELRVDLKRQFTLENVVISNVMAKNTGPYPIIIAGFKGYPVRRVTLRDILIVSGEAGLKQSNYNQTNWLANKYPGFLMYGTYLPAYGIVSNFTQDLVLENVRVIPAAGEVRPFQKHYNRK